MKSVTLIAVILLCMSCATPYNVDTNHQSLTGIPGGEVINNNPKAYQNIAGLDRIYIKVCVNQSGHVTVADHLNSEQGVNKERVTKSLDLIRNHTFDITTFSDTLCDRIAVDNNYNILRI